MRLKFVFFLFTSLIIATRAVKFKVTREWNYLNFTWPEEEVYLRAVSKGLYVPENVIPAGVKHHEGFFYVSLPRMKPGVPATLARIPSGDTKDTSPLLEAYPSWEMNLEGDCNALQNVQNVEIDTKGQIWIIDGGNTETLGPGGKSRTCPPKLVIFDIGKNMTTTAYTFPENIAKDSFLYDIVVDNTDGGYAYISDNSARDPGIIVFSVKDHHSWKIRHAQSMRADPSKSSFNVNGIRISAPINVAGIALGPKVRTSDERIVINEDREVFYSPLSSLHLYSMNTSVLRNEVNGAQDGEYQGEVKDYGLKQSQSVGMTMDNEGVLYYSLLSTNSLGRWDSRTPFTSGQKIIARDVDFLEWPSSFAFDTNGNITVLVNRLDKFIYGRLNASEPNFRLITANVGGRGYLYDQEYEYGSQQQNQQTNFSISSVVDDLMIPEVMSGGDPDPYLAPKPGINPAELSTAEPKPEPEPTTETEAEDKMDHNDHMNDMDHRDHDMMSSSVSPSTLSSSTTLKSADVRDNEIINGGSQIIPTFIAVLFACVLFMV